jgi:voltage-gated potassium channel
MRNHVIVCGYGRMGAAVADMLVAQGVPTVVVEKDPAVTRQLDKGGLRHVSGDATEDGVLIAAGIQHAKSLASVLPNDSDNLFVTLTSRELNPSLNIIARSSFRKNDSKMLAAGATRVLNPYQHGGRLMAHQLMRPTVTEFIDVVSRWGADLGLEEVQLQAGSSLAGVMLRDAPIRKEMDVIVVGVRRPDVGLIFNPPPDLAPSPGDVLIALGRRENLKQLALLASGAER